RATQPGFSLLHIGTSPPSVYTSSPDTTLLLLYFLFMPPPPPTSTLFPYTTLFRSTISTGVPSSRKGISSSRTIRATIPLFPWIVDRKSTRLNSSHEKISYAVFCLKKKKNKRGDVVRSCSQLCIASAHTCHIATQCT